MKYAFSCNIWLITTIRHAVWGLDGGRPDLGEYVYCLTLRETQMSEIFWKFLSQHLIKWVSKTTKFLINQIKFLKLLELFNFQLLFRIRVCVVHWQQSFELSYVKNNKDAQILEISLLYL